MESILQYKGYWLWLANLSFCLSAHSQGCTWKWLSKAELLLHCIALNMWKSLQFEHMSVKKLMQKCSEVWRMEVKEGIELLIQSITTLHSRQSSLAQICVPSRPSNLGQLQLFCTYLISKQASICRDSGILILPVEIRHPHAIHLVYRLVKNLCKQNFCHNSWHSLYNAVDHVSSQDLLNRPAHPCWNSHLHVPKSRGSELWKDTC